MINLEFKKRHKIGIGIGLFSLFVSIVLLRGTPWFIPSLALSLSVGWLPYWQGVFAENRRQKELEERFPDFVRNLTGAIKSGIPASQAVIHVSESDYGALTPYVKKLANQLEWSFPFRKAFVNFGKETDNKLIKRAIATVIQAEEAGGNIEDVLLSITTSLFEIQKIKQERSANIHSQIMQSYIIFIVFLGVMIIIQNLLVPYMEEFGASAGALGTFGALATSVPIDTSNPFTFVATLTAWFVTLHGILLMISLIQGFFAGAVLGKLAEGSITPGLKHSLILMTLAFVVLTFFQGLT